MTVAVEFISEVEWLWR